MSAHDVPAQVGRTSGPTPSERDAALPYVVDDVARVEALTSWDLDDWRH